MILEFGVSTRTSMRAARGLYMKDAFLTALGITLAILLVVYTLVKALA
jgi:hypothetical protein